VEPLGLVEDCLPNSWQGLPNFATLRLFPALFPMLISAWNKWGKLSQGPNPKIFQKNVDRPICYRYSNGCFEAHRAIPLGKPIDEID
jgi:hypothetical protein